MHNMPFLIAAMFHGLMAHLMSPLVIAFFTGYLKSKFLALLSLEPSRK